MQLTRQATDSKVIVLIRLLSMHFISSLSQDGEMDVSGTPSQLVGLYCTERLPGLKRDVLKSPRKSFDGMKNTHHAQLLP